MEPSFWSWEKRRFDPWLISKICAAMEPSFWSWEKSVSCPRSLDLIASRNGAQLLELGKAAHPGSATNSAPAAMEPSFWSWEKNTTTNPTTPKTTGRNGAQLLELGKAIAKPSQRSWKPAAMEPSFWSWEKRREIREIAGVSSAAMEPSFWSWEKLPHSLYSSIQLSSRNGAQLLELGKAAAHPSIPTSSTGPQWSPAFGAGKSRGRDLRLVVGVLAAMEPSFWSWEKGEVKDPASQAVVEPQWSPAFGAGKSPCGGRSGLQGTAAMEPSFWSWEKPDGATKEANKAILPQWSPAFGAGKSCPVGLLRDPVVHAAMEPSFWSWEKSSRFFHQLTTSVAHLCEQRKFWGRRVGLLLPDRLGKLALTRARALPRGTEGAGALARRSAGLGWVAPRGLQRI